MQSPPYSHEQSIFFCVAYFFVNLLPSLVFLMMECDHQLRVQFCSALDFSKACNYCSRTPWNELKFYRILLGIVLDMSVCVQCVYLCLQCVDTRMAECCVRRRYVYLLVCLCALAVLYMLWRGRGTRLNMGMGGIFTFLASCVIALIQC